MMRFFLFLMLLLVPRVVLAQTDADAGADAATETATDAGAAAATATDAGAATATDAGAASETAVVEKAPEDEAKPDPIVGLHPLVVFTPMGKDGMKVIPRAEIFAQYAFGLQYADNGSSDWFHQVDMTRGFLGAYAEWKGAHGGILPGSSQGGAAVGPEPGGI